MKKFVRPKLVGDEYLILFYTGEKEIRHAVCAASAVSHLPHDKVAQVQLVHRLPCQRYVYCETLGRWVVEADRALKTLMEPVVSS